MWTAALLRESTSACISPESLCSSETDRAMITTHNHSLYCKEFTEILLTVLLIGFCHTGPISLYVDLFVFICVYFTCFCFILCSCCVIVSTLGWMWWDWSLILRTYLPSVPWHCWLGHLTHKKPVPDMTYNVFGGTLNLALSIYLCNFSL